MVSLKITENVISKVLLAILGSWTWGPYGVPDLKGDIIFAYAYCDGMASMYLFM